MVGPNEFEDERGGLPDLTKRILTLGLGAYFLTEDTVRRYVKEAKLPRDVARTITQNAAKGKDELYGFIARELSNFLEKMDLQEELHRFVATHKIRINAEIEFVSRAPGEAGRPGPDIDWNVSLRAPAEPPAPTPPEPEEG